MSPQVANNTLDRDQAIALAVARLIAAERGGGQVQICAIPERDDRNNQAVELITCDAVGTLAIEHTRIEAFRKQIQDDTQIQPYAEQLPAILAGRLPAGSRYELIFDIRGVNGTKPEQKALNAIVAWVIATAPLLEDGCPGINGRHVMTGEPPDLPFTITLVRWPEWISKRDPGVSIGRWYPQDLEQQRKERLGDALCSKLPKIAVAEANGHSGVLILESNDIALSNSTAIYTALLAAAEKRADLPPWIVYWEQVCEPASVSIFRSNGEWVEESCPVELPAVLEVGDPPRSELPA